MTRFIPNILMLDAGPNVVWQLPGFEVTMSRNEVEALTAGSLEALASVLRWRFERMGWRGAGA